MPLSVESIIADYQYDPSLIDKVSERKAPSLIHIVPADPSWPAKYSVFELAIRSALNGQCLYIAHVGSTSVPGLPAKDVIDVDMAVPDPADETSYIPKLQAVGFQLLTREPHYYGHRLLIHYDPPCNLHVYTSDAAEIVRHRIFRDRLRRSAEDRERYGCVKMRAAEDTRNGSGKMSEYTGRKQDVIREILRSAFKDEGFL